MKKPIYYLMVFSIFHFLFIGCQKNIFEDDDASGGGNNNQNATWESVDFETERTIKNAFATPFQLYLITDNEFVRLNTDEELVEKRTLTPIGVSLSRPVMTDNAFVRLSDDGLGNQVLEFHLARNPSGTVKFNISDLQQGGDDLFEFEFLQRNLGAFNTIGNQFLLPAKVFQNGQGFAVFYLFEIEYNATFDEFISITFDERIELPQLTADPSNITNLVNLRYFNDNYYVSTKRGGFRISPDGSVTQLFPASQWVRDFFQWNDKLYMTALGAFDMHESSDDGQTWERLNQNSDFQMIKVENGLIFSQDELGKAFDLGSDDLQTVSSIVYSNEIPIDNLSAFFAIEHFNDKYYITVDKTIFSTIEIVTN